MPHRCLYAFCLHKVPTDRQNQGKYKNNSKSGKIREFEHLGEIVEFYFEMLIVLMSEF